MGRWSQSKLRGGGGQAPSTGPAAPVLAAEIVGLSWTWSDTDPDHWNIDVSDDMGITWLFYVQDPGSDRADLTIPAGSTWRIWGADAGNAQITGFSNSVNN